MFFINTFGYKINIVHIVSDRQAISPTIHDINQRWTQQGTCKDCKLQVMFNQSSPLVLSWMPISANFVSPTVTMSFSQSSALLPDSILTCYRSESVYADMTTYVTAAKPPAASLIYHSRPASCTYSVYDMISFYRFICFYCSICSWTN